MTNLVSGLGEVTRNHPDEPALWFAGEETTYAELWAMAGRFAAGLIDRGIEPGDPIALYLQNLPQFVVAFHGVLRAGGVVVPLNPFSGADEIRPLLQESLAGAVVTTTAGVPNIKEIHADTLLQFLITADGDQPYSTGFAAFLDADTEFGFWEVTDRDDDDVAVLSYTQGPDGEPVGVRLTHGGLASNAHAVADLVSDGVSTDDAVLGALPLGHVYGTTTMNATLFGGGTLYPLAQWDAGRALALLDEHEITIIHGVPAMYEDLRYHPDADKRDLSSLRLAGVAGPASDACQRFETEFDVPVHESYGLTETSGVIHFDAPDEGRRPGSVGTPLRDVETRIVDENFDEVPPVEEGPVADPDPETVGEIVVAGPSVMLGYHNPDDGDSTPFTEADGKRWLHTGDVGYRDEDGYVYVLERDPVNVLTYEETISAGCETVAREVETVTGGCESFVREVETFLYGSAAEVESGNEDAPTDDEADERADERADETNDEDVAELDVEEDVAELDVEEDVAELDVEESPPEEDTDGVRELVDISGVSDNRAETLRAAGFESIDDIRDASRDDLAEVEGIGDSLADRIKSQVEDEAE